MNKNDRLKVCRVLISKSATDIEHIANKLNLVVDTEWNDDVKFKTISPLIDEIENLLEELQKTRNKIDALPIELFK